MPEGSELVGRRMSPLVLLGGIAILLDTVWGGIAVLGLDLGRGNELVMGISFVLGLPTYLLDLWLNRRIAVFLIGLFFFRWIARCFGGPTPVLCNPLDYSIFLILAFTFLQWAKLRREK